MNNIAYCVIHRLQLLENCRYGGATVLGVLNGAEQIETTFLGIGEQQEILQ